ncbi:hypothetical protein C8N25_10931 [Algoriphagus antarcticus]|uniref:ATPase n=1 Tax=Algoriphagus antarcticus TaxID=238540 RepID=A0A3E0DZ39_9BACT|nr:hypothetical protein C8N25_10931 [Algoriphagus antarcticus]
MIQHIKYLLPYEYGFIYLDILATENEQQFLDALGSALVQSFPEKSSIGKRVWEFIKGLRPIISFDQLSGTPQVSFQVQQYEKLVQDILIFLSKLDQPNIVAIDELQQIHSYPEKNTDAWLRSTIQQLHSVTFLFSGSRQTILSELFSNPKRPFYKSTNSFKLKKIPQEKYREFIVMTFAKHGRILTDALADEILIWTKCRTYYVQHLCNRLFQLIKKIYGQGDWQDCAQKILKEQEVFFFHFRSLLSKQQWRLLVAIAKTGVVFAPTSKDFISKNKLGSAATVFKSIDSLLEKEMIFKEIDQRGAPFYQSYDVFFERWIQGRDF